MKFKPGDRVSMLKHADWKTDAVGTVVSPGRLRTLHDGSLDHWYWVGFDEPQQDYTDEIYGDPERSYRSASVLERFLRPLE